MKTKRILAALALAATVFTTSCAEPATLLDFMPEDSGPDLDGTEIKFAWCHGAHEHPFYIEDTLQYDSFLKRVSAINDALNCQLSVEMEVEQTPITVAMQTGSESYDIVLCNGIYEYTEAKMLHPFDNYPDIIDLNNEKKFGSKNFQESMMYQGLTYGISPVQWPGFESTGGYLTMYNRDIFQEYNIPDFLEYFETDNWTWDTFRYEYMDKYTLQKSDGSILYSLHTNTSDLYQIVFYSNGMNYIEKAEDGTLSAAPFSNEFISAMQYWHDVFQENRDKIEYNTNTYTFEPYVNGEAAVGFGWNSHLVTGCVAYNENSFETGVLPIPAGPNANYGEWCQVIQRGYGMVLPLTSTKPEASAKVINMLCEPFEEFGGDEGLFEYYRTNVFPTDHDAQIYLDVLKDIRYDYTFEGDRYAREISYAFADYFESTTVTINDAMERARVLIDHLTSEYMIGNYEAVYGDN